MVWRELLGVAAVYRHDRFAELGGDSILSLKLLGRLRKTGLPGARQLSLAEVLAAGSLAELAERLAPAARPEPDVVHLQRAGAGVPLFCLPGLIVNSTEFAGLVEVLGGDRPVCGFVSHVYTAQRWRGFDLSALARDYADYIEKATAGGRCALLGWSSGGDLAFETARLLRGRLEVAFLGLVDVFESVRFRPSRRLAPAERQQARARIEAWLARSEMAAHWRELFALLDPEEQEALEDYALAQGEGLPLDGPDLASREFELWALLDKRLRAARWDWRPLDLPVQVWQAEHSLARAERLRDWSALSPVVRLETVARAAHLDIIHDAGFRRSVRAALREIDRPARSAVAISGQS